MIQLIVEMAHVTKNTPVDFYQQEDIILFVQIFTYTKNILGLRYLITVQ